MDDIPQIVFIFFDGGGVLFNGIPSPMLRKLATSYGNDSNLEEYQVQQIRQKVATANQLPAVREAWIQLKTNPAYTEQMYWEVLINAAGLKETVQQCMQLVRESMLVQTEVLRLAQTISYSTTESGERRHIGILSNHAIDWFSSYVAKGNVNTVFTNENLIVVSQHVKCAKPDFMIFQAAMARIATVRPNTRPEEILFFDDKEANVEAARQFGWNAEYFNNEKEGVPVMQQHLNNYGVFL